MNLACLPKASGEKQKTYTFAYTIYLRDVHAVAADEFLMAHNTKVKSAEAPMDAGIRFRVRSEGGSSVFHHGSRGITPVNKFSLAAEAG